MVKEEERIFAASEFVLTEYVKGVEANYYMSTDRINAMVCR